MAEFYRDVPHFETGSRGARYGFHDGRFTMRDMADCTYNREIRSDGFVLYVNEGVCTKIYGSLKIPFGKSERESTGDPYSPDSKSPLVKALITW